MARNGRYFVALLPPLPAARAMQAAAHPIAAAHGGRLLSAENLHMTLAFVGSLALERQEALARCVYAASAPMPVQRPVRLERCGAWSAGVAWLAPAHTPRWIAALVRRLRAALDGAGIAFDHKPFRAHVTVVRGGAKVPDTPIAPLEVGPWRVALMRSFTESAGSRYVEVPPPALASTPETGNVARRSH